MKACPPYAFDHGDAHSAYLYRYLLDASQLERIIINGLSSIVDIFNLKGEKRRRAEAALTPVEKARIGLPVKTLPELRAIKQLLDKWRDDVNLPDSWCTDNALVTMWWWHVDPRNLGKWCPLLNLRNSEVQFTGMAENFEFNFLP